MSIRFLSSRKFGLTLVELLIAVGLIGMIVLAIMAIDVASRRFFNTSDFETRVQNEVSPILDMITKDILRATGQRDDRGIILPSINRINIRQDTAQTYSNYSDDPWVAYFLNNSAISTERRANATSAWTGQEKLAGNIVNCEFAISADTAVQITITARRDASQPASSANPEVRLESSSFPRLHSIN